MAQAEACAIFTLYIQNSKLEGGIWAFFEILFLEWNQEDGRKKAGIGGLTGGVPKREK
jgi:hypothetical protein